MTSIYLFNIPPFISQQMLRQKDPSCCQKSRNDLLVSHRPSSATSRSRPNSPETSGSSHVFTQHTDISSKDFGQKGGKDEERLTNSVNSSCNMAIGLQLSWKTTGATTVLVSSPSQGRSLIYAFTPLLLFPLFFLFSYLVRFFFPMHSCFTVTNTFLSPYQDSEDRGKALLENKIKSTC